jgi:hypothetical protein
MDYSLYHDSSTQRSMGTSDVPCRLQAISYSMYNFDWALLIGQLMLIGLHSGFLQCYSPGVNKPWYNVAEIQEYKHFHVLLLIHSLRCNYQSFHIFFLTFSTSFRVQERQPIFTHDNLNDKVFFIRVIPFTYASLYSQVS